MPIIAKVAKGKWFGPEFEQGYRDAAHAHLIRSRAVNWIDIRDAQPPRGVAVLVFAGERHRIASISSYGLPLWFDERDRVVQPTHWASLTIPATTIPADSVLAERGGGRMTQAEAIKALLEHLPELWGDEVIEGEIMLRVEASAIHAALDAMHAVQLG